MKDIPLLYGSPNDKAVFNPEDFVKLSKLFNLRKFPKYCILAFSNDFVKIVNKKFKCKKITPLPYMPVLYKFKYKGIDVGITNPGIGGPFAGAGFEEYIALGIKKFITIGSGGALQKNMKIGGLVLADKAIRDEGTSYHYLKPSKYAKAHGKIIEVLEKVLKKKKMQYHRGTTWTTDALFRETIRKVRKYQKEGVLSVEMEAAALFAIATFRKVELGSIYYVSDSLADLKWKPHFLNPRSLIAKRKIINIALDAILLMDNDRKHK